MECNNSGRPQINNNNIRQGTTVQVQRPLCYFVRSPHERSNRGDLKSQVLLFAVISRERESRVQIARCGLVRKVLMLILIG